MKEAKTRKPHLVACPYSTGSALRRRTLATVAKQPPTYPEEPVLHIEQNLSALTISFKP